MKRPPQIVAMGGYPLLDDYVLSLTGKDRPRVCFVPTASGDEEGYVRRFYEAFPPRRAAASELKLFCRDATNPRQFAMARSTGWAPA